MMKRHLCHHWLCAVLVGCFTAGAFVATEPAAAEQSDFSVQLAPGKPATNAAFTLHIVYRNPADPNGKPSPIRHLVITVPQGSAINVATVPRCTASDPQLQAQGPRACPPSSQVGSGTLTAITGFGSPIDPFTTNVTVFNDGHGWIEVVQDPQSGATIATDRIEVNGDTLTGNPPTTPGGPPEGETAVRTIDFIFPVSTGYLTTPPSCPPAGAWTSTAAFTFADGSTQRVGSTTACRAANPGAGQFSGTSGGGNTGRARQPHLHLSASPRRVHTGRSKIRFTVRSLARRCARNATIRFNGHAVRTNSRGRATILTHLSHPGPYRATLTKQGCSKATTTVTAARATPPHFTG